MIAKYELYLHQLLSTLNIGNWMANFALLLIQLLALTLTLQLIWLTFCKRTQLVIDRTINDF